MADDQPDNIIGHELFKRLQAVVVGKRFQIGGLDFADGLQALRVKVIIETGKLQGRAVDLGHGQQRGIIFG